MNMIFKPLLFLDQIQSGILSLATRYKAQGLISALLSFN